MESQAAVVDRDSLRRLMEAAAEMAHYGLKVKAPEPWMVEMAETAIKELSEQTGLPAPPVR